MMPYLSGDDCDEIERAKANGKTDDQIAGHYKITPDELCRLMEWPSKPAQQQTTEFDLFACERLDAVL